jgi:hypothetical protein
VTRGCVLLPACAVVMAAPVLLLEPWHGWLTGQYPAGVHEQGDIVHGLLYNILACGHGLQTARRHSVLLTWHWLHQCKSSAVPTP